MASVFPLERTKYTRKKEWERWKNIVFHFQWCGKAKEINFRLEMSIATKRIKNSTLHPFRVRFKYRTIGIDTQKKQQRRRTKIMQLRKLWNFEQTIHTHTHGEIERKLCGFWIDDVSSSVSLCACYRWTKDSWFLCCHMWIIYRLSYRLYPLFKVDIEALLNC